MKKYNLTEFAELANVSRETLNTWLQKGLLVRKYKHRTPYLTQDDLNLVPGIRVEQKILKHKRKDKDVLD